MIMTLREALKLHKELWEKVGSLCDDVIGNEENYDYSDGEDIKIEALELMGFNNNELNFNCFCCEYAGHCRLDFESCQNCPVDWSVNWTPYDNDTPCCMGLYGEFDNLVYDGLYEEAKEVAYAIADLPINPIYKEED